MNLYENFRNNLKEATLPEDSKGLKYDRIDAVKLIDPDSGDSYNGYFLTHRDCAPELEIDLFEAMYNAGYDVKSRKTVAKVDTVDDVLEFFKQQGITKTDFKKSEDGNVYLNNSDVLTYDLHNGDQADLIESDGFVTRGTDSERAYMDYVINWFDERDFNVWDELEYARSKNDMPVNTLTNAFTIDDFKRMFDVLYEENGINGELFVSYDEFLNNEYKLQESESSSNKYAYLAHVLNFLNNTAPGGISDGEIRVLADVMYNIDTGKGELPREESTFVVTPEQKDEVTSAIETDDLQRFLGVLNNIVVNNSEPVVKEAAGPEIPAYYGDPNDDPDWHPESKRNEKPEQEVIYFKEKNRPEPTGDIVTSQDLNYPGVTFETTNNEHLYIRAWWSDNGALDDEERDEWEDPDDVWGIYYTIYNAKGEEVDGGIMYDYDYGKWSSSELANNLLSMSGYTKHYDIKVLPLEEVEDLLEESQTQEIEGIVSDMVKSNPKAEKYLDEYLTYINTLEPKSGAYNNDTDKFNDDWENWYKNTANVIYNPTAWNKFIEWVKEKYGEEAVKGLDEGEELKKFKFNVYTASAIGSNASASRLANTVYSLKEAEELVKGYREQKLKAHYAIKKD